MTDASDSAPLPASVLELLARWQAFSDLQQRAFAFLAEETMATGQEFESSTGGATRVLTRIGDIAGADADQLRAETWAVVHRLQAADRSRQGLEQVASVLGTLQRQHAELVEATVRTVRTPDVEGVSEGWIGEMAECVCLTDWRRRLVEVLHGRDPGPRDHGNDGDDEELF